MEESQDFFEISDMGGFIRLTPLERINYNSDMDWDKNWMKARIEIKSGAFNGNYIAQLMTLDLVAFRKALFDLYNNLKGEIRFEDRKRYLIIDIKGDGIGHFEANCEATDNPGIYGTTLSFDLAFDQTEIMPMVRQLDVIIIEYPVIGKL